MLKETRRKFIAILASLPFFAVHAKAKPTIQVDFMESSDAREWARAFCLIRKAHPELPADEEAMVGWFANAIMRGYDDATAHEIGQRQEWLNSHLPGDISIAQQYDVLNAAVWRGACGCLDSGQKMDIATVNAIVDELMKIKPFRPVAVNTRPYFEYIGAKQGGTVRQA